LARKKEIGQVLGEQFVFTNAIARAYTNQGVELRKGKGRGGGGYSGELKNVPSVKLFTKTRGGARV